MILIDGGVQHASLTTPYACWVIRNDARSLSLLSHDIMNAVIPALHLLVI